MRIAHYIARCGVCSRREAEELILEGRVKVSKEVVTDLALQVEEGQEVLVDGQKIVIENTRIFLFHKPVGVITSKEDMRNRPTVYDFWDKTRIKNKPKHLIYVGRLDINSEGLLLFTNNGQLSRSLTLPKNNIKRVYKIRVFGVINEVTLQKMKKIMQGVTLEGVVYGKCIIEINGISANKITSFSQMKKNNWIKITLTEGKNREVRKLMEWCRLQVSRLIRVSYHTFSLGALNPGEFQEVPSIKIQQILAQLPHTEDA